MHIDPVFAKAMSQRLQQLRGNHPYAFIAELTGVSIESARRQIQSGIPHADFLARLCLALKVSPEWLLLGKGPVMREHAIIEQLNDAGPEPICGALGTLLAQMRHHLEAGRIQIDRPEGSSIEAKPAVPKPGAGNDMAQRLGHKGEQPRPKAKPRTDDLGTTM